MQWNHKIVTLFWKIFHLLIMRLFLRGQILHRRNYQKEWNFESNQKEWNFNLKWKYKISSFVAAWKPKPGSSFLFISLSVLVFIVYICYVVLQESLFTQPELKPFRWFLTWVQFAVYIPFGGIEFVIKRQLVRKNPSKIYLVSAFLLVVTMGCSNKIWTTQPKWSSKAASSFLPWLEVFYCRKRRTNLWAILVSSIKFFTILPP